MEQDQAVYSDTRFYNGMWHMKENVTVNWAAEVVKVVDNKNSLYSLTTTSRLEITEGIL
jgi:hypothetical protein